MQTSQQANVAFGWRSRWTLLTLSAIVCPVLLSFALLWHAYRAVPMYDDYQAVVYFTLQLHNLPTVMDKLLYIVAAQHDEYKLILEHVVIAGQFLLLRHLSFGFLIWLGNLLPLGIGCLFWQHAFPRHWPVALRLLLFVPISFLFFQLNYVENQDWAMCSLQTFPVLLFGMLALSLLLRPGRLPFALACSCAILSCLASANGFLLAPIALPLLYPQRATRRLAAWTASFAVSLSLYLYHYHQITRSGIVSQSLAHKMLFFFSFLGASVENQHHFPIRNLSVVLGVLLLAVFLIAVARRFDRSNPFLVYVTVWFLLSALLVTQVRSGQGMLMSLALRYKIYSDFMLIFAYVYGMTWLLQRSEPQLGRAASLPGRHGQLFFAASLGFAVALNLSSAFFGHKFLQVRQMHVERGLDEYLADPAHNPPMISQTDDVIQSGEPEFTRVVLNQARAEGVYQIPAKK